MLMINKTICCQCICKSVMKKFSKVFIHTETTRRKVQEELPAMMMRSWQIDAFGSLDNLKLLTVPIPEIHNPSDILIKIFASSINPIDLYMIEGFGNNLLSKMRQFDRLVQGNCDSDASNFPLTFGRDFSGQVVATGQNVKNVAVGDNVCGVVGVQNQGCHSEYALTSGNNVCTIPKNISIIEGASLPYVGLTCWSAVVTTGGIRPEMANDKRILVLGASGGLGSLATQMLSSWGAEVVGVCNESSLEFVRSLGALEVYDYRNENAFSEILADPRGFHLLLDASGTADIKWMQTLRKHCGASLISLRSPIPENIEENGFILGVGKSIASIIQKNVPNLSEGRLYKWGNFSPDRSALEYIFKMVSQEKIQPKVAKVFPFDDAPTAYKCYSEGGNKGKIVLDIFNN